MLITPCLSPHSFVSRAKLKFKMLDRRQFNWTLSEELRLFSFTSGRKNRFVEDKMSKLVTGQLLQAGAGRQLI